jgi:deazaflavin-dependent oxidoreductase (nitroreductase family)
VRLDPAARKILDQVETVEITTRGRTSGEPRRIEIWMYAIDGRYIITGTPGPRDWYANVVAHPRLTLHLPEEINLEAAVTTIDDPEFRNRVFTAPKTWWYRDQTTVADLVAHSPMIEMHFE